MFDYFETSYRDLERAVNLSAITDECIKIGKGMIKTETSKFIFNGCNAYTHILFNVFTAGSFTETNRILFERFTEKYLMNPEINGSSLNPRVLAFCYLTCVHRSRDGYICFYRPDADELVRGLYELKHLKTTSILSDKFRVERLKEFVKENGINEVDIVRYLIFIEKFEK